MGMFKKDGSPKSTYFRYYDVYKECGGDASLAAKKLGIEKSTVKRGVRAVKAWNKESEEKPVAFQKELETILSQFSKKEIQNLIKGHKSAHHSHKVVHDFRGEELTLGVMTDTHIGSKYTNYDYIYEAFRMFEEHNVDFMMHCGDVTEGMYNNRAGHFFECTEVGYEQQLAKAKEIFSSYGHSDMFFIAGNHDETYKMQSGACIVSSMCKDIDNATFCGHHEGDVQLGNTTVRLWHGTDGSSYAHSYRLQKVIEAFTGGDKPNVLLAGHVHKSTYVYDRHVHCVSAGAMQKQSKWMRTKRLPSHTGFYIIKMVLNENGVATFSPTFYPFYA